MRAKILLTGILLVYVTGCTGTSANIPDAPSLSPGDDPPASVASSLPADEETPAPPTEHVPTEEKTEPAGQELEQESDILRNDTADMTIMMPLEPQAGACGPGASLPLPRRIDSFLFETPSFSASQAFLDLYFYSGDGASVLEFTGNSDAGYYLKIYNDDETVPRHQYLLESGQLLWVPVKEGQKLFITDLPPIPMEEILNIYPNAILPEGFLEVEWPGGYTMMLWCREPLYDVRISATSYEGNAEDGTALYLPVDWDSVEGFDLMPGKPLFTDMVSVGSSYLRAFRFMDSQEREHIYLLAENGRGGDWPSLMFSATENVRFSSHAQ